MGKVTKQRFQKMIIFIHGYGTSGKGEQVDMLREQFGDELVVPELRHKPAADMIALSAMIIDAHQKNEKVLLIGCSLGGFYAKFLSALYNVDAVLINPAYTPSTSLTNYGTFQKYDCDDVFGWGESQNNELQRIESAIPDIERWRIRMNTAKLHFFVATDDELLDHSHLKNEFAFVKEFDNCGHRFFRFGEIVPDIMKIYVDICAEVI
jgi:predicted esterase YcpF (UPF0227 family)